MLITLDGVKFAPETPRVYRISNFFKNLYDLILNSQDYTIEVPFVGKFPITDNLFLETVYKGEYDQSFKLLVNKGASWPLLEIRIEYDAVVQKVSVIASYGFGRLIAENQFDERKMGILRKFDELYDIKSYYYFTGLYNGFDIYLKQNSGGFIVYFADDRIVYTLEVKPSGIEEAREIVPGNSIVGSYNFRQEKRLGWAGLKEVVSLLLDSDWQVKVNKSERFSIIIEKQDQFYQNIFKVETRTATAYLPVISKIKFDRVGKHGLTDKSLKFVFGAGYALVDTYGSRTKLIPLKRDYISEINEFYKWLMDITKKLAV